MAQQTTITAAFVSLVIVLYMLSRHAFSSINPDRQQTNFANHAQFIKKRPFVNVLVMTTSVAGWVDRRQRIRTQFPRNLKLIQNDHQTALLVFAVGTQKTTPSDMSIVRQEASQHNDILFLDCVDEDDALKEHDNWDMHAGPSATTNKVMYAVQWAVRQFDFEYFFRLGDDSYLRIDNFMLLIASKEFPTRNAVIGQIWTHHVFGLPQKFAQGSGYALTYDVCAFIAQNAGALLQTAPEDCVVSRWLYALGTTFVDSPLWRELALNESCDPDMVLAHKLPAELWSSIQDDGSVQCH